MIKKYNKYKFSSLILYLKKKLKVSASYKKFKTFLMLRKTFKYFLQVKKNIIKFNLNIVYFSRFSFFFAKKKFYKRCLNLMLFEKKIRSLKLNSLLFINFKLFQHCDTIFNFNSVTAEESSLLNFNFYLNFFEADAIDVITSFIKLEDIKVSYKFIPVLQLKTNNIIFKVKNNIIGFNTFLKTNFIFKINNIILNKNISFQNVKILYKIEKYKKKIYRSSISSSKKKYNKFKALNSFKCLSKTYKKIKIKNEFKKNKNFKNKTFISFKNKKKFKNFIKGFYFKKTVRLSPNTSFKRIKL